MLLYISLVSLVYEKCPSQKKITIENIGENSRSFCGYFNDFELNDIQVFIRLEIIKKFNYL